MSTQVSQSFDHYHRWLGIAPRDQPPNHYRLLGLDVFENDPDVIESAADRQMKHVRSFQTGQHSRLSQQLLNDLASARICLLNPEKKATYDIALRAKLAENKPAASATLSPGDDQVSFGAAPVPDVPPAPVMPPTPQLVPQLPKPPITHPAFQQPTWPASNSLAAPPPGIAVRTKQHLLALRAGVPVWKQPVVLLIAAAACGLVLLLAAGIVIRVATDKGELVIESDQPGVEVLVKQGGQQVETIETALNKKSVTIRSGSYEIELRGAKADTVELDQRQITLRRGEKVIVKVTQRPAAAKKDGQPSAAAADQVVAKPDRPSVPGGGNNVATGPAPAEPNPFQEIAPPPRVGEVGAVVDVARMNMVSFDQADKLPDSPSAAFVSEWIDPPKGADINNGVLQFTVKEDGVVYLLTNTNYQGNRSGGWWEERVTKEDLVKQGWQNLGPCPWNAKETLLKRSVKAGESYRIRTNKYGPPRLITPAPLSNGVSKTVAVSPPPAVETRAGSHLLRLGDQGGIELADTKGMIRAGQPATVEFWARLDPEAKALNLIGDRVLGGNHPDLGGKEGGFLVRCNKRDETNYTADIMFRSGGGTRRFELKPNQWQHFAVCSDMERLTFFVDGKLVAERKSDPNDWAPAPLNLHVGFHGYLFWSIKQGFHGDLRAFRVSSTCRYRDSFTPPEDFEPESDTTVLLDFGNSQGDRIQDRSGSGHHGKITGGQWIAIE